MVALAGLVLAFTPLGAVAQRQPDEASARDHAETELDGDDALADSAATAEAGPSHADRVEAARLFELANVAYVQGRFGETTELLREAVSLYPHQTLVYNLARTLESMGSLREAIEWYERYLSMGETDDTQTVRQRVESLRHLHRQAMQQLEEIRSLRAQIESETPVSRGPVPWVLFGIGVAGAGASFVPYALSWSERDAAELEPSMRAASDRANASNDLYVGAVAGWIGGGVLGVVGLLWGLYGALVEPSPVEALRDLGLRVDPRTLQLEGRF